MAPAPTVTGPSTPRLTAATGSTSTTSTPPDSPRLPVSPVGYRKAIDVVRPPSRVISTGAVIGMSLLWMWSNSVKNRRLCPASPDAPDSATAMR